MIVKMEYSLSSVNLIIDNNEGVYLSGIGVATYLNGRIALSYIQDGEKHHIERSCYEYRPPLSVAEPMYLRVWDEEHNTIPSDGVVNRVDEDVHYVTLGKDYHVSGNRFTYGEYQDKPIIKMWNE